MRVFRLLAVATALLCLASYEIAGAADDAQQEQKQKKGQFQKGQGGGFGGGRALLSPEALSKLVLSADQKEKYDRINDDYQEQQKAAGAKLRDAFQSQDKDKIKDAVQSMRTDNEKRRGDALDNIESFLTADQKKIFAEVKTQQPGRGGFGGQGGGFPGGRGAPGQILPSGLQERLKLSDDQKKKVEELQKEIDGKLKSILTEEQRKQLEEMKNAAPPRPNVKDA